MITDSSSSRGPTISESPSCVIAVLSPRLAWQLTADMSDNCACGVFNLFSTRVHHHQAARWSQTALFLLYGIIIYIEAMLRESNSLCWCVFSHYLNHQWGVRRCHMCLMVCVECNNLCAFNLQLIFVCYPFLICACWRILFAFVLRLKSATQ